MRKIREQIVKNYREVRGKKENEVKYGREKGKALTKS